MRIGIIVGKDDYNNDDIDYYLDKGLSEKFLTGSKGEQYISSDIAVSFRLQELYPNIMVDMILPKDISKDRLAKNNVNYILGHDLVDAFWRKKFGTDQGYYKQTRAIYSDPKSRIFPMMNLQDFVLDKGEYYQKFNKAGVPVMPSFYIKNNDLKSKRSADYIIEKVKKLGWTNFITKPELGAWGRMFKRWDISKLVTSRVDKNKLEKYMNLKDVKKFPAIIFQKEAPGFKMYWEIRTFWFNEKFGFAVGTKHDFKTESDEITENIPPEVLEQCKKIGKKALKVLPKQKVNGKVVKPVMMRIDLGCCMDGLNGNYFLNEIENQACNLFSDTAEEMGYDVITKFAKTLYSKSRELEKLGWKDRTKVHRKSKVRRKSKVSKNIKNKTNRKNRKKKTIILAILAGAIAQLVLGIMGLAYAVPIFKTGPVCGEELYIWLIVYGSVAVGSILIPRVNFNNGGEENDNMLKNIFSQVSNLISLFQLGWVIYGLTMVFNEAINSCHFKTE